MNAINIPPPMMPILACHPFRKQSHPVSSHVIDKHWDLLAAEIQEDYSSYVLFLVNGSWNQLYTNLPKKYMQLYSFQEWIMLQQENKLPTLLLDDDYKDVFCALNAALFDQGYLLQLADDVILEKPLIIYNMTIPTTHPVYSMPRLVIWVGKNSKATIIDKSSHANNLIPSFTNTVKKIFLKTGANLHYYNIQEHQEATYQVTTTQLYQEASSSLHYYTYTFGAPLVKNNVIVNMQESYSKAKLYGLYSIQNRDHVDNYIQINHNAPDTTSRQLYKGIISNESTGVFNGTIHVHPVAEHTNAFQTNHVLITSNLAKHYTKPQLEIYADDVQCSHGATIAQLDQTQLFYLRSRGIPQNAAQQLLLQAFANEIIEKVDLESLQLQLLSKLEQNLIMDNLS